MNLPVAQTASTPIPPQAGSTPALPHAGSPASAGQYLTFSLQGEAYGVDILRVREIIEYARPTTVPMMPGFVHGVINLRGHVVPVIDLAQRFGRAPTELRNRTCIVILEVASGDATQALGVLVDAVNAVLDLEAGQIEPAPSFGTGLQREFIQGMARLDSGFIILLDVTRVLSTADLAALAQASDTPAA